MISTHGISRRPCCCGSCAFEQRAALSSAYFGETGRQIVQCTACGLVTRAPSLSDDATALQDLPREAATTGVYAADSEVSLNRLTERLARVGQRVCGKRLLDLGAGTGSFLSRAIAQGWDAMGVELDADRCTGIQSMGVPCIVADVCQDSITTGEFDVIHANHVFEHLADPASALRNLRGMLTPKGLLIIEVPNEFERLASLLRRVARKQLVSRTGFLEHEWFYSPRTLDRLLRSCGFNVHSIGTPRLRGPSLPRDVFYAVEAGIGRGSVIEAWSGVAQI